MPRGGKRSGAGRKRSVDNAGHSPCDKKNEDSSSGDNGRSDLQITATSSIHSTIQSKEIKEPEIKESKEESKKFELNREILERQSTPQVSESLEQREASRLTGGTQESLRSDSSCEHSSILESASGHSIRPSDSGELRVHGQGQSEAGSSKPLDQQVHTGNPSASGTSEHSEQLNAGGVVELTDQRIRILSEIISDPVKWGEWLYESPMDEWQREAARAFAKGERIARAVCNGGGKTRLYSILGTWILAGFRDSRVIMTAGVYRQCEIMRDVELRKIMPKLTGWKLKDGELVHTRGTQFLWYAADNPGYFEGHHADHVGVLIDECKSVERSIYDASERLTANKKRYCMAASSTGGAVGWFYECFGVNRDLWNSKQISAYMIPRIPRYIIEDAEKMKDRNPALFKSKILGEFTDIDTRNMINLEQINRCLTNPQPWRNPGFRVAGIDLSAAKKGGDEMICVVRQGNKLFEPYYLPDCQSEMEAVGLVVRWLKAEQIKMVFCDAGGLGSPMIARLKEVLLNDASIEIHSVNFGGNAANPSSMDYNRGTELWSNGANKIELRDLIFDWTQKSKDKFIAQVTSRSLEPVGSDGYIKLETKEKMRSKGLKSPDLADATFLALIEPAYEQKGVTGLGKTFWKDYKDDRTDSGGRATFGTNSNGRSLGRG